MYRIVREIPDIPFADSQTQVAKDQTLELLRKITDAPQGNFDVQTHEQHIAYVEEVVIGGLRSYYARTSPEGAKARDRHYRTLRPRIDDIASFVSGLTCDDIAEFTNRPSPRVSKSIDETIALLSGGPYEKPAFFRARYRERHRKFKADKYSGLLGVIRFTEPSEIKNEGSSWLAEAAWEDSSPRRNTRRDPKAALSGDAMGQYLKSIGETPVLRAEQEVELAKRIEAGLVAAHSLARYQADLTPSEVDDLEWLIHDGAAAMDHFYTANLRLVVSIAIRYREPPGMTRLDLIQEGNLGLKRAIEKFDYTKGYKFSTYASNWIKQAITKGMANQSALIRKPVHVYEEIRNMDTIRRNLERQGIDPTPQDIADEMGCDTERVSDLSRWQRDHISLDTPLDSGKRFSEGPSLMNLIAENIDDRKLVRSASQASRQALIEMVSILDRRTADILLSSYGVGTDGDRSLEDIGKEHGISAERVRQIQRSALERVRAHIDSQKISA